MGLNLLLAATFSTVFQVVNGKMCSNQSQSFEHFSIFTDEQIKEVRLNLNGSSQTRRLYHVQYLLQFKSSTKDLKTNSGNDESLVYYKSYLNTNPK